MRSSGPVQDYVPQYAMDAGLPASVNTPGKTLAATAQGLEGMFLSFLVKEMRQTLGPDGLFGKDGGDVWGGMFDQFMAQHLSQAGGFGLANALKQQLEPAVLHGHGNDPTTGRGPDPGGNVCGAPGA
jgi:Rod binding domain-containing protein